MQSWKRSSTGASALSAPRRIPERAQLEQATSVFKGRRKIAILAEAGARGGQEELLITAERLGTPIVKAMLSKDSVPDDSPYTTGDAGRRRALA
jgi:pyruvate dehydrogenase (quinone)